MDRHAAARRCSARRMGKAGAGIFAAALLLAGCDSTSSLVGGIAGGTVFGAFSPGQEIEQIYYLGAFDPRGQLPPAMYRLRVHGQASAISGMKFASGWVPAGVIDSLGSHAGFKFPQRGEDRSKLDPRVQITDAEEGLKAQLSPGRRLMQFGPEGFREAPADHRLVIVMGQSPDDFFEAVDGALGDFSVLRMKQDEDAAKALMLQAQLLLNAHRKSLDELDKAVGENAKRVAGLPADEEPKKPEPPAPNDPPPNDPPGDPT